MPSKRPCLLLLAIFFLALGCTAHATSTWEHARNTDTKTDATNSTLKTTLRALYHGYLGHANFGDELIYAVFGHLLRDSLVQMGWKGLLTLELESGNAVLPRGSFAFNPRDYDFLVVGGGSLLNTRYSIWVDLCERTVLPAATATAATTASLATPSPAGTLAARRQLAGLLDDLRGPVPRATSVPVAPALPQRTHTLPTYLHATGTEKIRTGEGHPHNLLCISQPLVGGGVRGPETNELLRYITAHHGLQPIQFPVLGDSGLLASRVFPMWVSRTVRELDAARQAAVGGAVVCVSGNLSYGGMGLSQLVKLWSRKHLVVLMPVDPNDLAGARAAYLEVTGDRYVTTDGQEQQRVFINQHITTSGVWLALLRRCDVMLTVRLHALIVATSAARPVRISPSPYGSDTKFKDFLVQTHGTAGWARFYLLDSKTSGRAGIHDTAYFEANPDLHREAAVFDGSLEALDGLLTQVAAEQPQFKAAAGRATSAALVAHMSALSEFLSKVVPDRFKAFDNVHIRLRRFSFYGDIELSFW